MADETTAHVHDLLRRAILATDHDERYALTEQVGLLGVDADRDVPLLIELLGQRYHWFARSLAVWELLKLGPDAAVAVPDLAALADERGTIIDPRWASLWALERMGPAAAPAIPTMIGLLRDEPDPDIRSEAAFALGATASVDDVVPALDRALEDPDSLVREEAARALGRIGPQAAQAVPALVQLVGDPVRPVREAALEALARLGETTLADELQAEASRAATRPAQLDELLERLRSDDARLRAETSWPVGKLGADAAPALPAIVHQLRTDEHPDARWGAAWCVGRIGNAAVDAVPEVIVAVQDDPDPDVRAQAANALGHIGLASTQVVDALVSALDDAAASMLREEALVALARLGPSARMAVPAIRARLADRHPMVRQRARAALVAVLNEV